MGKDAKEIFEDLKNNSIGKEGIRLINIKSKGVRIAGTILSLMLIFSTMCSCVKQQNNIFDEPVNVESNISNRTYYYNYDDNVVEELLYNETFRVREVLVFSNEDISLKDNKICNTVEEYKAAEALKDTDLIGFYEMVNKDEVETEKVIQALGYKNWDDYLISNNYIDKEGKPNKYVWLNDESQRLYDEYLKSFEDINESKGISK